MKKLIAAVIAFVAIAACFYAVSASGLLPEDVEQFYDDCGHVCYVWPDGSGDCYPCVSDICQIPTDVPPVVTEEPKDDPTEEPTLPPPPTVEPTPEPTKKPKCNSGRGNGSEGEPDCDPGNSGKNRGGD